MRERGGARERGEERVGKEEGENELRSSVTISYLTHLFAIVQHRAEDRSEQFEVHDQVQEMD